MRQLYEDGKTTDKKHRFRPHIIARYQLRVKLLEQAASVEELYPLHSLHYDDQYRIEFTVKQVAAETVVTICNILELSNHYK